MSNSTVSTETITYSFVQFYYQKLHEDPTKLYQVYTQNAKLTHSAIPETKDQISYKSLETSVHANKDQIEKFYTGAKYFANSKIRVSSIDSQSLLKDSILINVIGELALTDESPVFRFTQSFVLTPGNVANSYDIANDIFRLIPDDDFELNNVEEVQQDQQDQREEEKFEKEGKNEEHTEVEVVAVNGKVEHVKPQVNGKVQVETELIQDNLKEEVKTDNEQKIVNDEVPVKSKREEIKEKEEKVEPPKEVTIEKSTKSEEEKSKTKSEQPQTPAKPLSWAQVSLTAKQKALKEKEIKKAQTPPSSTETNTSASSALSQATTTTTATTGTTTAPTATTTSTNAASPPPSNNKNRKQNNQQQYQHAIVVNNIGYLKAAELRTALEEAFGKTIKVEPKGQYGLVAFETKESQQSSLNKGKLRVGDVVVTFENKNANTEFNDKKKGSNAQKQNNRQGNGTKANSNGSKKKSAAK